MDIHGPGIDIDVAPPNPVEQRLARPDPACAFHEGRQQTVFGGGEFHRDPGAMHAVGFSVQHQIALITLAKPFTNSPESGASKTRGS